MTEGFFGGCAASGSTARAPSRSSVGIPRPERADAIPGFAAVPSASAPKPAYSAETEMPPRRAFARPLEPVRTGASVIAAIRSAEANPMVAERRPVRSKTRSPKRRRTRSAGRISALGGPFPRPCRSLHTFRIPGVPR